MIRRTGIMAKNAAWEPGSFTNGSLETLWQEWVANETTKRFVPSRRLDVIFIELSYTVQYGGPTYMIAVIAYTLHYPHLIIPAKSN